MRRLLFRRGGDMDLGRRLMPWGRIGGRVTFEEVTVSRLAEYLALLGNQLATEDRHDGPTGHCEPFVGCVVGPVMQDLLSDYLLAIGVPEHDVGVEANRD